MNGNRRYGVGLASAFILHVDGHVLLLDGEIALVGAVFAGTRVRGHPVHLQAVPQQVVAAEGEVHRLLQLEARAAVVLRAGLGLYLGLHLAGSVGQVLVANAVAVLPVVAAVVDTVEVYLVVGVEVVVHRERVALALARHIVLAHLCVGEDYVAVVVEVVLELGVVRTGRRVLVRYGGHYAELVVEEAVAPRSAEVELHLVADPVVARAGRNVEHAAVRGVLGDEVDGSADGVAVHVGRYDLVDLDGLYHVGRYEVELHVAGVALGRGQAVAVNADAGEVGRRAAHLSEAGLALVILHVDTVDALQGVAYVRVGELSNLV